MATEINIDQQMVWAQQPPSATLDYSFDLTPLLGGDTLASCTWVVSPAGPTIVQSSTTGNTAQLRVAGAGVAPNAWYALTATWATSSGQTDDFTFRLFIEPEAASISPLGTALFPNRFTATAQLRQNQLLMLAKTIAPGLTVTDDYVWSKLCAAEADMQRRLRVAFQPTAYFPLQPTSDQITALNGMPWDIDPGYDYSQAQFAGDSWGYVKLRNKPIVSVDQIQFAYPAPEAGLFTIPADWIRIDAKYGSLQLVPSAVTLSVPLSSLIMQAIAGGRTIPYMMQVTYKAGLQNAASAYPDLVDVVQKLAALKIIEDSYLPQSGSISADGLSQSLSVDMDKYRDTINTIVDGPKGSNGGLMTAIHGVRVMTLG